jgi:hypothetical protein
MVDKFIDQSIYWRNFTDDKGNNFQGYTFVKLINDKELIYRKISFKKGKYWMKKTKKRFIEDFKDQIEYRITDKKILNDLWNSIRSKRENQ